MDITKSYVADYAPGPNWISGLPLKGQPLKAHVDYLIALHEKGTVFMGGPFRDGSGGLVLFTAEDLSEVEKYVAMDPAIAEGLLVATVRHWARIV